jgi:hypothetical protein
MVFFAEPISRVYKEIALRAIYILIAAPGPGPGRVG